MANKTKTPKVQTVIISRPPVVTIMGHVDHGKTTLLDNIRHSHVADKEHGGITQHIGAYQVDVKGQKITFIDTPGHEAFSQMRARGSQVTDIVILVVAADDGVMPQTKESIAHITAAGVPFIVAANKIDAPGANLERVKKELAENNVLVEGYGGNVPIVPISAKTGDGVGELLEMVQLVAEMEELQGDPKANFKGVIIESEMDKFKGPIATVLVQNGTLHTGDPLLAGKAIGKVKALINDQGTSVKEALPSTPVEVLGFTSVPAVGSVVGEITEEKIEEEASTPASLFEEKKQIRLLIKADKAGSLEALNYAINQIDTKELEVKFILKETGDINESDVLLAQSSRAIIIGFGVKAVPSAQKLADEEKVNIRTYNIIYELLDELKEGLEVLLKPKVVEEVIGQARVKALFESSKGKVAGSEVTEGNLRKGDLVHIKREEKDIITSKIKSLRYQKEDIPKATVGEECGVILEDLVDFAIGDIIQAYKKI